MVAHEQNGSVVILACLLSVSVGFGNKELPPPLSYFASRLIFARKRLLRRL